MEGLAPGHHFLLQLRLSIENGQSLRTALRQELQNAHGDFYRDLQRWFVAQEQGVEVQHPTANIYRQALFQTLEVGLRGQPIHAALLNLETEFEEAAQDDIERHLRRLPIVLLVPLLFLQFPAFLLLLLGPLLSQLVERLS